MADTDDEELAPAFGAQQDGCSEDDGSEKGGASDEPGTDVDIQESCSESLSEGSQSEDANEDADNAQAETVARSAALLKRWPSDTLKLPEAVSSGAELSAMAGENTQPVVFVELTCELPACQKSSQERLALLLITSHERATITKLRREN